MFTSTSRYHDIEDAHLDVTGPDGSVRQVPYKKRRFLPPVDAGATVALHRVVAGDRLDLLAAAYLGEPTAFWRLCDANPVLHPRELTAEVGTRIRVALPEVRP